MGLFSSTPTVSAGPTTMTELQQAVMQPLTQSDMNLWTPSGKACCFADAEELAFRIRQLEIVNYAVEVLSSQLVKDPSSIDYEILQKIVMEYRDADRVKAPNHDWRLLSGDDDTFKGADARYNAFKEFERYFMDKAGASRDATHTEFTNFLIRFKKARDTLVNKYIVPKCKSDMSGGGSRSYRRPVSRRHYY